MISLEIRHPAKPIADQIAHLRKLCSSLAALSDRRGKFPVGLERNPCSAE
jgi:hypothetical protein